MKEAASTLIWTGAILLLAIGCSGEHEGPGEVAPTPAPDSVVRARLQRQAEAVRNLGEAHPEVIPEPTKQILFGDLHVHTTFSADAFYRSLPAFQGEGAHPTADACDFARYCADLDFWSITDHGETLIPRHWSETKESIRQCNAVSGDPAHPDTVAFVGFEWTQVGRTPETHYGHKNVIFSGLEENELPARPIAAQFRDNFAWMDVMEESPFGAGMLALLDFSNRKRYLNFSYYTDAMLALPSCPKNVDTRELPIDCREGAATPEVLFEKLDQWGFDTIVIPHGTSWGFLVPPGTALDNQLTQTKHDPEKQTLFEIYSGHGNSEEYRDWRAARFDENGKIYCPEPTEEFTPCCWQTGEIILSRCDDPTSGECEKRVAEARQNYVEAGIAGHLTVPGEEVEDWGDCGQCRDCFLPAYKLRPGHSGQYALAIANFDKGERDPLRFRFGFIASSDNHSARPGTGYKEYGRRMMTETAGGRDEKWRKRLGPKQEEPAAETTPITEIKVRNILGELFETERQASFFLTGGLVAAHAEGRDRGAIWDALKRKEVYGTSGPRILLWFDLLNGPGGLLPMGSETALSETPRFRVQAVGSFKQKPGCPEHPLHALGLERLEWLCRGECYNPTDERNLITRVDVVRIRPQVRPGEPVGPLIEDPWRSFACPRNRAGCAVEFKDPGFKADRREVVYYVRAIQEETPAVNAESLRCEYDESGRCVGVRPCYGDYRTPYEDDCLAAAAERAWSSPIFLRPALN